MKDLWRTSADFVLGTEPKQRLRVGTSLLWLVVYPLFAGVQHVEVLMGLIRAADSWPPTAWTLTGATFFFASVRSGLNLKLVRKGDPAWTIPLMLGSVMLFKASTDPARYDPRVEAMHMLFASIVMATVWSVSKIFGRVRERLQQQRSELSKALEHIQLLATRDELTGLANRRAASQRMREELELKQHHGEPEQPAFAVVLMDIDHFKRVNDTFGHAVGDEVLPGSGRLSGFGLSPR